MAEKTLYTALGHFRCRNDSGGRRYPGILMDQREFGMDPTFMNSFPTEWSFSPGAASQTALTGS